jgi:hypothetical protein
MQEKIYPSNDRNTDIVWDSSTSWGKQIPQTQHGGTPDRNAKQAGALMANYRDPLKRPELPHLIPRPAPPVILAPGIIFVFSEFYFSNIDFHEAGKFIEIPHESNLPRLQILEDIIKPPKPFKKLKKNELRKDGKVSDDDLYPWEIKFFDWLYSQKLETSFKRFCQLLLSPIPSGSKVQKVIKEEEKFVPLGDYKRRNILIPALFSDYNLEKFLEPEKLDIYSGTINTQYLTDRFDYDDTELLRFSSISKHFTKTRIPEIKDDNLLLYTVDLEAETIPHKYPYVFNYQEKFIGVYFEHCFPEITNDNYDNPYLIEIDSVDDDGKITFHYVYGTDIPARAVSQSYTVDNYLSCFAQMKGRLMNNDDSRLFIPTQKIYSCSLGDINVEEKTIQVTVLGTTRDIPLEYIEKEVAGAIGQIYIENDWSLTFYNS